MDIVTKTAPNTKKGFLSTCQSMIGKWMNGHIFGLTTETNIDLDDSKQPIALFIITRDYDKSDNAVAGLFLNWVYRKFLEKAEKAERKRSPPLFLYRRPAYLSCSRVRLYKGSVCCREPSRCIENTKSPSRRRIRLLTTG